MKLNMENLRKHGRLGTQLGKILVEVSLEPEEYDLPEEYMVTIFKDQDMIDQEEYESLEDILIEWDLSTPWYKLK